VPAFDRSRSSVEWITLRRCPDISASGPICHDRLPPDPSPPVPGERGQIDRIRAHEPVVDALFSVAFRRSRPLPDDADVAAALAQLAAAQRPVLVVGGGARIRGPALSIRVA